MEIEEISFHAKCIDTERNERNLDGMRCAAFTAWLQGAGEKKSWNEFLNYLKLSKRESKMTKTAKKMIVNRAHSVAERIIAMDKGKKK